MDSSTERERRAHKRNMTLISAIAVVLSGVAGGLFANWDKIFPPHPDPGGPGTLSPDDPPNDPTKGSEPTCKASQFDIRDQPISTSGNDASTVNGDSEINSDDWTRVSLGYHVAVSQKAVTLTLTWEAQELNSNKSLGDTRIRSQKTMTLYKVPTLCTKSVITGRPDLDADASQTKEFSGEQHSLVPFANRVGNIGDIRVRFDGPGRSDHRLQQLEGVFRGFSVSVSETP